MGEKRGGQKFRYLATLGCVWLLCFCAEVVLLFLLPFLLEQVGARSACNWLLDTQWRFLVEPIEPFLLTITGIRPTLGNILGGVAITLIAYAIWALGLTVLIAIAGRVFRRVPRPPVATDTN